jgi:hypothetical protein
MTQSVSMHLLSLHLFTHAIGTWIRRIESDAELIERVKSSKIVLVLLGTGEAYIADSRKDRNRVELCETIEDSEEDQGTRR